MKDLYIFIESNENRKHFLKEFTRNRAELRKQAMIYFGISIADFNFYIYTDATKFAETVELNDSSEFSYFLIYVKSMTKFKKEHKATLSSMQSNHMVVSTWLVCVYLDKAAKAISYAQRNKYKKNITMLCLECFGLDKVNNTLDNLKYEHGFRYHKVEIGNSVLNTVLNSHKHIEEFVKLVPQTEHIACDTEFFNIGLNTINTKVECYIRTLTFSMLIPTEQGMEHHTFEFAVEDHLTFTLDRYLDGIAKLKAITKEILKNNTVLFLHNASADLHLLCKWTDTSIYECNGIIDTISAHFVNSPHSKKGLKTLIQETDAIFLDYDKELSKVMQNTELDYDFFKPTVKEQIDRLGIEQVNAKWIFMPLATLLKYNSVDSFVTLNLGLKYVVNSGLHSIFFKKQLQVITLPFLQIEENGLPLNLQDTEDAIEYCRLGVIDYESKLANLGIVTYYRYSKHIKACTDIIVEKEGKINAYLSSRGLKRTDWRRYKPTQKYTSQMNTATMERGICRERIKKLNGKLHEVIISESPMFLPEFNFGSSKQKVELLYDYLGLEELLVFADMEFHTRVRWNLKKVNPNIYKLFILIEKEDYNGINTVLKLSESEIDADDYDLSELYWRMKLLSNFYPVLQFSRFEKKTDENVMGNILKSFGDHTERSKQGLLYKIALYVQSASKISKVSSTYLQNYIRSTRVNLDGSITTHSSFKHTARTSRQSGGSTEEKGGGINSQNVSDSTRMPKRYAHLKPYVATIKKVVQMGHSEFTDAVKADIDWDKKQFAFTSFNTVLKNHPTKRVFIEFDYSQIELYILAMMADVRYMLKVINEGKDLHSMTAALTMNKSYDYYMGMTKQEKGTTRHDAKTMNFTFSFLGSAHSAQQYASKVYGIVKATEFWQDLEERFHTQYNEIRPFAYTAFRQVMETGVVTTITGHTRRLDEEHSEYFEIIQNMYNVDKPENILEWVKTIPYNYKSIVMKIMRKAVNTQIQGSANSYTALSVAMNYNYIKENKGFPNHIASTYPLSNKMPKSVVQHNVVHDAQYVSCEIQDLVATIRTYNEVMTIRVKEYIKDNFAYETNIPLGIGCTIGDSWYGMLDFHIDGILKDGTFVVAD